MLLSQLTKHTEDWRLERDARQRVWQRGKLHRESIQVASSECELSVSSLKKKRVSINQGTE
jgi:hypothetical protein